MLKREQEEEAVSLQERLALKCLRRGGGEESVIRPAPFMAWDDSTNVLFWQGISIELGQERGASWARPVTAKM